MRKYSPTTVVVSAALAVIFVIMFFGAAHAQTEDAIVAQYKAHIDDLGNVGNRYATAQTFYMSLISTLIAILSTVTTVFAVKEMETEYRLYRNPGVYAAWGFVFLFVAVICYLWHQTLEFYHVLFEQIINQLKAMEIKYQPTLFPFFGNERLPERGLTDRDQFVASVIGIGSFILACVAFLTAGMLISAPRHGTPRSRIRKR